MTTLILGGARSGKSQYARQLAESLRAERVFVATAEALDDEMANRISRHIAERGESWTTVEAPLEINACIRQYAAVNRVTLVDCLTLWLSNLMRANFDIDRKVDELVETLDIQTTPLLLVSNEVGMGIVPESPLGRAFRDAHGRMNQKVAAACDNVRFVAAGLPLTLKG